MAVLAGMMGLVVAGASSASAASTVLPVYGTSELDAIACMSPTSCIAVGEDDYVLVQQGTDGGADTLAETLQLSAIACPTSADCFAVGNSPVGNFEGVVVPFVYGEPLPPILVPGTVNLASIACTPGTTSCVAVGDGYNPGPPGTFFGTVVSLADGTPAASVQQTLTLTGLNGVACSTSTSCVAVGDATQTTGGIVPITSGVAGTPITPSGVFALNSVACATAASCFAGAATNQVVPLVSGVAGTPVTVSGVYDFQGATCPTATQCYLSGNQTPGGFVLPITSGTVGLPTTDVSGSGSVADLACISVGVCLGVGDQLVGNATEGVLITSAVPTPPPTITSGTFAGSGDGITLTVKGTNFGPWPPEPSPVSPVGCAPGSPSYDYASGILSFTDTTESWSAGNPGACVGLIIKSWSTTSVTLGFGTGYVWPLLTNDDSYQVSILGATYSGIATVPATAPPAITSVLVGGTGGSTPPTLTVVGSGLGTRVPLPAGSPTCVGGDLSSIFTGSQVFVSDATQGWTAGRAGDCLGLVVTSWTATKVVLTFGAFYGDVGPLQLGDSIEVGLLDATWSGLAAVNQPPRITGLTVAGTPATPKVTVTGTGFGTSPPTPDPSSPISCVPGDTSFTYPAGQLQFTDGWTAGENGDCIGLVIASWSNTRVVLRFGADYPNFAPVKAGDTITVEVKGTSFTATAGV